MVGNFLKTKRHFISLFRTVKKQRQAKSIMQKYWEIIKNKSQYDYPVYIKIRLRKILLFLLSENDNKNSSLPIIYLNGSKEEVLNYIEKEFKNNLYDNNKFIDIHDYIPYLTQRFDGVEILSTFLKNNNINEIEGHAILIRDCLMKHFSNDLSHFTMLDMLENIDAEVFHNVENKVILIKYDIKQFQKKFKLKGLFSYAYYYLMNALEVALKKQKFLKIHDANITETYNEQHQMILEIDKNILLTEKDFIQIFKDYYAIFIQSNINIINKISAYDLNTIPQVLIENGLVDWLTSYLMSYQLNKHLEEKDIKIDMTKI